MKKLLVSSLLLVGLAVGSTAMVFAQSGNSTQNNQTGYGNSMMGGGNGPGGNGSGYGYGMGPGMMGYGYGPGGNGGGYGYGMGPGMMGGGYGYGMGPGMMGGGYGYGMGPGMMGYGYGPNNGFGYGNRGNGWQQPEQVQKFLDQTVKLRRELNDKEFDYREALRNPKTTPETLAKLEKEIIDLRNQISNKAAPQR